MKEIYFNDENMGLFEVRVVGDTIFIIDKNVKNGQVETEEDVNENSLSEERFMQIKTKSNHIAFISQDDETIVGTRTKMKKDDIDRFIRFDLTLEQVTADVHKMFSKVNVL